MNPTTKNLHAVALGKLGGTASGAKPRTAKQRKASKATIAKVNARKKLAT